MKFEYFVAMYLATICGLAGMALGAVLAIVAVSVYGCEAPLLVLALVLSLVLLVGCVSVVVLIVVSSFVQP